MQTKLTHASLFSGIGGFDLAAQWAGWENVFNCEINPFCQQILKYFFTNAEQYSDIHTTDFTFWKGKIDILSGGFPCQPFSLSGKRRGTADERYLWREMLRAIREVQPRWVVGENVRGIVSWSGGVVFEQVCLDLETEGYEVTPYILPACAVNAPHERYRTWFIAHRADAGDKVLRKRADTIPSVDDVADSYRDRLRFRHDKQEQPSRSQGTSYFGSISQTGHATAPYRLYEWNLRRNEFGEKTYNDNSNIVRKGYASNTSIIRPQTRDEIRTSREHITNNGFNRFPTQSPICSRDDGVSGLLDDNTVFAGVKQERKSAYVRWRTESIKGAGNAIVPQVALQIFNTINEYELSIKRPR